MVQILITTIIIFFIWALLGAYFIYIVCKSMGDNIKFYIYLKEFINCKEVLLIGFILCSLLGLVFNKIFLT